MKNERKIFYGAVTGIIVFALIGWIFSGTGPSDNNLKYLSAPTGAYNYAGNIDIERNISIPKANLLPRLMLSHRDFSLYDAKNIAHEFGMNNVHTNEFSEYYEEKTNNESLIVYKDGYKITYRKDNVDIMNVSISDEKLIDIANGYLNKFKDYIPRNVNIKVHSVINDRLDVTADENEVIKTYYTKDVIYDCYFKSYFVGLILKVELDHRGNLVGFESMPVEVSQNGYINIQPFSKVHKWMEGGLPVTMPPKLIKSVEIKDVRVGILPIPTMFGSEFKPVYIVDIHITGIDPTANDDYTLDIGGIEE